MTEVLRAAKPASRGEPLKHCARLFTGL